MRLVEGIHSTIKDHGACWSRTKLFNAATSLRSLQTQGIKNARILLQSCIEKFELRLVKFTLLDVRRFSRRLFPSQPSYLIGGDASHLTVSLPVDVFYTNNTLRK